MSIAPVTLVDLNQKIKSLVKEGLGTYWLTAEISEITINYSGHCYLELIQKEEDGDKIVARSRATIWSNTFRMIKPYFETTTGRPLSEGINVMIRVKVEFHEVYGLSLNIIDIEPTYTVGELAVRKQKILEKLKAEGVLEMNKELNLPYLPQHIAVISSKTAAGLEDFIDQLQNNPHGFSFNIKLFPAVMQGNSAENSIINQLDNIYKSVSSFDAVVIIRGGGAQADLDCFNSYWLAYNITQFPLPVITGIGHEQDDTVTDMVANIRLKTPTATAEFLIDRFVEAEDDLLGIQEKVVSYCTDKIATQKQVLKDIAYNLHSRLHNIIAKENLSLSRIISLYISASKKRLFRRNENMNRKTLMLSSYAKGYLGQKREMLNRQRIDIKNCSRLRINNLKYDLEFYNQKAELNNPEVVLKKGYSITLHKGKVLKNSDKVKAGDEIETLLHEGKIKSITK